MRKVSGSRVKAEFKNKGSQVCSDPLSGEDWGPWVPCVPLENS